MVRNNTKSPSIFAAFLLTVLSLSVGRPAASAAVIVVAPTSGSAGSFTITQDITFTINTAYDANIGMYFVLDNWVVTDATHTAPSYTPQLSVSFNGGAAQTYGAGTFTDNINFTSNDFSPNDGYFTLAAGNTLPSLVPGNTITVKAASYTLAATSNFNTGANQTFVGNMFIARNTGNMISNTVAVPEPGGAAFLLGGLALLGAWRRR